MSRSCIAVASGKGGTGKTTVAVNLGLMAARAGREVQLLDCDVEAPNAHLFLDLEVVRSESVGVPVPLVDVDRCDACGECGAVCRFSAIVSLKTMPLVFPELCHGCGGCVRACPTGAITEEYRTIGSVDEGSARELAFAGGRLNIGEAMSPPLIRAVKRRANEGGLVILDAPPGNTCPVIETVRSADFVVLVTEPTPFGLSDLKIAVETMRSLARSFGVVINRAAPGRDMTRRYCELEGIEVLAELPDDRRVAEAYSRGKPAVEALKDFRALFTDLFKRIESLGAES
jgi:MinD superfamily P-loop ATPase